MTKEGLKDIALELIDKTQRETPQDAAAAELAYLMAYNDVVLAFLKTALQKEEATCVKAEEH